ncbi:MAG TPA: hypothetical protein VFT87_01430 [Candidatus Saccharimonadales bacterium]|nr:hypothetical protein [Candidatus Saccharimonadales bacterium]
MRIIVNSVGRYKTFASELIKPLDTILQRVKGDFEFPREEWAAPELTTSPFQADSASVTIAIVGRLSNELITTHGTRFLTEVLKRLVPEARKLSKGSTATLELRLQGIIPGFPHATVSARVHVKSKRILAVQNCTLEVNGFLGVS